MTTFSLSLLLLLLHGVLSSGSWTSCAEDRQMFRDLLLNARGLVDNNSAKGDLCYYIHSKDELIHQSETVEVCAPNMEQSSNCMLGRKSLFNETQCRSSIVKDLDHYERLVRSYLENKYRDELDGVRQTKMKSDKLHKTLDMIGRLMVCLGDTSRSHAPKETLVENWKDTNNENRRRMCAMMKGFKDRVITFNRAFSYINSGDCGRASGIIAELSR